MKDVFFLKTPAGMSVDFSLDAKFLNDYVATRIQKVLEVTGVLCPS